MAQRHFTNATRRITLGTLVVLGASSGLVSCGAAAEHAGPLTYLDVPVTLQVDGDSLYATLRRNHERTLLYRVAITNRSDVAIHMEALRVRADSQTLRTFNERDLANARVRTARQRAAGETEGATIRPGAVADFVVALDLTDRAIPAGIAHEIAVRFAEPVRLRRNDRTVTTMRFATASIHVAHAAPVPIDMPVRGEWIAENAAAPAGEHRYIVPIGGQLRDPTSFAVDLMPTPACAQDIRAATAHPDCARVFAGRCSTVVGSHDDDDGNEARDASVFERNALNAAAGTWLSFDCGSGITLFLLHLRPGSLRVRPGDIVTPGTVVGEVGMSGAARDRPHLHVQVGVGATPVESNTRPFVFTSYTLMRGANDAVGEIHHDLPRSGDRIRSSPHP